jgi:hypothetical protein
MLDNIQRIWGTQSLLNDPYTKDLCTEAINNPDRDMDVHVEAYSNRIINQLEKGSEKELDNRISLFFQKLGLTIGLIIPILRGRIINAFSKVEHLKNEAQKRAAEKADLAAKKTFQKQQEAEGLKALEEYEKEQAQNELSPELEEQGIMQFLKQQETQKLADTPKERQLEKETCQNHLFSLEEEIKKVDARLEGENETIPADLHAVEEFIQTLDSELEAKGKSFRDSINKLKLIKTYTQAQQSYQKTLLEFKKLPKPNFVESYLKFMRNPENEKKAHELEEQIQQKQNAIKDLEEQLQKEEIPIDEIEQLKTQLIDLNDQLMQERFSLTKKKQLLVEKKELLEKQEKLKNDLNKIEQECLDLSLKTGGFSDSKPAAVKPAKTLPEIEQSQIQKPVSIQKVETPPAALSHKEKMFQDVGERIHPDIQKLWTGLFALFDLDIVKNWQCDAQGNFTLELKQPMKLWVPSTDEKTGKRDPSSGVVLLLGTDDNGKATRVFGKLDKAKKDMNFKQGFHIFLKPDQAAAKQGYVSLTNLTYNSAQDITFTTKKDLKKDYGQPGWTNPVLTIVSKFAQVHGTVDNDYNVTISRKKTLNNLLDNWTKNGQAVKNEEQAIKDRSK